MAKTETETLADLAGRLRAPRNLVAKTETETLADFAGRLRAPRNLVAKGGIEPPTHGFSVTIGNGFAP
ncbi:MAG: hypothetical protein U1F15_01890 [Burkholderiales bacterium]